MLELSAFPEAGFICLDEFCKNPTYTEGQVILFDNDDDFLSFSVAPVAVVKKDKNGEPTFHGQYTEIYQKCLEAGMKFGIRTWDSFINIEKIAKTRVLIPEGFYQRRKDILVHLRIQGIKQLFAGYYLCNDLVYTRRTIVAKFVCELVYKQGKTEEEVRTILRSWCQDVLSHEQFEELNQEEKDQYNSFSIKRVKYHYRDMSVEELIKVAAQNSIRIENLVIKKVS